MENTVFAVALNHKDQYAQWQEKFKEKPYMEPPKRPIWFIKPRNTYLGDKQTLTLDDNEQYFSGGTVALVLGKTMSQVTAENALSFIKGMCLVNEISLAEDSFYRPAIKAKCRDHTLPIGSMVPLSSLDDVVVTTTINGEVKSTLSLSSYILGAPALLEALSEFVTLEAGDMLIIGTPFERVEIKRGDCVEISAPNFTTLTTYVA